MINKYKKKPVIIEAVQFTRSNFDEIVKFTEGKAKNLTIERTLNGNCYCTISTLEGPMKVSEHDYIIKGVQGEFYSCKPDIFEKTYEMC